MVIFLYYSSKSVSKVSFFIKILVDDIWNNFNKWRQLTFFLRMKMLSSEN